MPDIVSEGDKQVLDNIQIPTEKRGTIEGWITNRGIQAAAGWNLNKDWNASAYVQVQDFKFKNPTYGFRIRGYF